MVVNDPFCAVVAALVGFCVGQMLLGQIGIKRDCLLLLFLGGWIASQHRLAADFLCSFLGLFKGDVSVRQRSSSAAIGRSDHGSVGSSVFPPEALHSSRKPGIESEYQSVLRAPSLQVAVRQNAASSLALGMGSSFRW